MRLQMVPNFEQSEKQPKERSPSQSENGNGGVGDSIEEENESRGNDEDDDDEDDEEMVVDLELPPGRYSFQLYDYERFLRLQKQLQKQNRHQGTKPPEQDLRQQQGNSQLPGILKKQSAYSAPDSNSNDDNNSSGNRTISPSRSSRRPLQQPSSSPSSFISRSYIASVASSLLGWKATAPSNKKEEETNNVDDTTRILWSDETASGSNTTPESSRSLTPSSSLPHLAGNDGLDDSSSETNRISCSSDTGPDENQDLIDKVYHLQTLLRRKQNEYRKAKKSRQTEDKRLLKLAQQLQTVDVDHLNVKQSIAELETTNEGKERSLANYKATGSYEQNQEKQHVGRYQQDQQVKLKMVKQDYDRLMPRYHQEIEKLRRKNQASIDSLKQQLLHETIELQRLVQLSQIHHNSFDHR